MRWNSQISFKTSRRTWRTVGERLSPMTAGACKRLAGVALGLTVALGAACGEQLLEPSQPTPSPGGTSAVPAPFLSLSIVGPTSVAPGDTATFAAIATRADGATEDVTS